jgi:signal transduction histidine kinase
MLLTAMPEAAASQPSALRPAVVVTLAVMMLTVAALAVWYRSAQPTDGARGIYVTSSLNGDGLVVSPILGVETALRSGDEVQAIEGVDLETWLRGSRPAGEPQVGDTLRYRIDREGTDLDLDVPLVAYPVAATLLELWGTLAFCVVMLAVGGCVFARRPREEPTAALLLLGSGLLGSTVPWILGFGALDLVDGTSFWLWMLATFGSYGVFWTGALHFAVVFPRRLGVLDRLPGGALTLYLAWPAVIGAWFAGVALASGSLLGAISSVTTIQLVLVLATALAMMGLIVAQLGSASEPAMRAQVRWIAWGGGISGAFAIAFWFGPELIVGRPLLPWNGVGISGMAFPGAIAVAVLRHRLFEIDVVINRTLVYGGLTAAVVTLYGGSVTLLSSLLRGEGAFAASLLATGVAALAALPVRDRLQRAVDRLMYGDRLDPYRAISRLGERLGQSLTTEEVLPTVVATVAAALRLPYVAIELRAGGVTSIAASTGTAPTGEDTLVRMPLVDQGEPIGELIVAPRSRGESFSAADHDLLGGLASEAGRAARSVRLAAEVERSRRQVVAAREEERRRLRRDLHDGLGPTLAGARLKLQAARARTDGRPEEAARLLAELDRHLARVLDDVRRISRGLRPPALDELGLMPALRAQAAMLSADSAVELRIDGPDSLPALPAAVEAAAYWITVEALTNMRRHSGASHCAVRIALSDALEVDVEDDGIGISARTQRGVGLTGMRERAAEVGGTCEIAPRSPDAGTRVVARLPLALSAGSTG